MTGCVPETGPKLLKYDDGKMDGSLSNSSSGHAVHFKTPRGNWGITGVRFFGKRTGSGLGNEKKIVVSICDSNVQQIAESAIFQNIADTVSEKWRNINVNPPVLAPGEFWVILDTNSGGHSSIFVGYDTDVKVSHSKTGDVGGPLSDLDGVYDWMIRVELKELSKAELKRLTGEDSEE